MQETTEHRSSAIAVDNIIDGKDIMFRVENDIRFKGVKMTAANVDIEACNFEWETSSDQYEYEYNLGSVGIEVDLVNGANSSIQQAVKDLQSDKKIHHENYIKATGNLKLHLSGAGHFIGCSLEGATLDIKANNLILESVQDIISERLAGMSMHLGFNSAYNAQQIGLNVESGFKKAKWSNQVGQILGSQMVNVVVNETLELAGGIIANQKIEEGGNVTDEANLNINCSRLIVKTIHDYDEGVTLGIGASFQVHKTDNGNDVAFSHMPLKVKYKDQQRDLHGTIGQGNIKSHTIEGDSLNRDIKKTADTTASEEFGFDAAVHKSMFVGDSKTDEDKSLKKLYRSMVQEGTFMQKLANSATDIAGNIKDTGKNLLLGGAKLINIFGGQIDRDLLDQKLHEIIGKDIHTGIDVKEQERHIAKIQREIDTLSESEDLDYEKESDREHAYNKIAYVALFNKLEEAIKKIKDTKEQSYLTTTNIILQAEYKEELKKAKQDNRPVKSVEVFVNEFLTSEKFNKPVFNAAKQTVMHSVSGAKAIVDSLVEMIKQEGANLSISDIWDAIKPNSGIAAGEDYKALAQEESSVDNAEYGEKVDSRQITEEVSKEALHNSLIVLKASELGLPISQLVSDPKAYDTSLDVLNLDLTISALNKYAATHNGAAAGAASRISKELVDIRQEVIKGGPSFSSVWEKTKANLMSGKTTILNPTPISLDAMGNMVSYVEDKVGYIVASNMPKTTATLKAGFGYAMEKVIAAGLEGAVEVFGQENVESSINSLKKGLKWVDENSTKGHQKLLEYVGIYAATKVLSKVIVAVKHNKISYLSEDLIPSLSKQEAHGVKILEKNGLNNELRNFSTVHEWEHFPDHVNHLETKLPDVHDMTSSYPKQEKTLGIRKAWNQGHSEAVIKKAKPDSEHACQQVDYVSLKSNGQVLAKDGSFITKKPDGLYKANPQKNNPLAPDPNTGVKLPYVEDVNYPYEHPDAHIPLSEWIKWKEWNKP